MQSLVRFGEGSGYTQYGGYFVPRAGEFHIGPDEYRLRCESGWPTDLGPGTVTVGGGRGRPRAGQRQLDRARFEAAGP